MRDCYVFDAVRTPRGRGRAKDGSLAEATPLHLAKTVLWALPTRGKFDSAAIEDVILGCVEPVGEQGANIGRLAALASGYDDGVPGVQINRFCASGLEAVNIAAQKVRSGFEDLVLAGGVESMSRCSMGMDGGAWAMDPATNYDTGFVPQGIGADLIATLEGFSRTDVDAFALGSQQKAAAARANGYFKKSVVPVRDQNGVVVLAEDEFIKANSSMEGLGKLGAVLRRHERPLVGSSSATKDGGEPRNSGPFYGTPLLRNTKSRDPARGSHATRA